MAGASLHLVEAAGIEFTAHCPAPPFHRASPPSLWSATYSSYLVHLYGRRDPVRSSSLTACAVIGRAK